MSDRRAFKYRIYPTAAQADLIGRTIGCARFVYNKLLDNAIKDYESTGKSTIPNPTAIKNDPEYPFLLEVDKFALDNARINLTTAYTNFFRDLKEKKKRKSGRPKFKSKHKSKWAYKTNFTNNNIGIIDEKYIKLPKLGKVKLEYHRELCGNIKSVTVTLNRDGSYEVSVLCDVSKCDNKTIKTKELDDLKVVGLDMSMENLIVPSKGEKTKHPKAYRTAEQKLKRKNRKLSKKQKDSKNRERARLDLAKQHKKVANQRKDFLHKTSRSLVNQYDVIAIETLDMSQMSRSLNLGKSVHDVGFGMFRQFLEYKAKETDTFIFKADKYFPSTQLCNHCGHKNPKTKDLSVRVWDCDACGATHDRDGNSAINLENLFIDTLTNIINTAGTAEIKACGDRTSTRSEMIEQVLSLNQEAPSFR